VQEPIDCANLLCKLIVDEKMLARVGPEKRSHTGYHHQVSHHIHCNDDALDEDVFSAFPLLRFDARLPRHAWHQWQHLYMWVTFPFLQLGFQFTDILSLFKNRTEGASLHGATAVEKATVLLGKAAHWGLLWAVPIAMHGAGATVPAALSCIFAQGVVLASTFAVSHNIPESKPLYDGAEDVAIPVCPLWILQCWQTDGSTTLIAHFSFVHRCF
jgi:hypothetical protein